MNRTTGVETDGIPRSTKGEASGVTEVGNDVLLPSELGGARCDWTSRVSGSCLALTAGELAWDLVVRIEVDGGVVDLVDPRTISAVTTGRVPTSLLKRSEAAVFHKAISCAPLKVAAVTFFVLTLWELRDRS